MPQPLAVKLATTSKLFIVITRSVGMPAFFAFFNNAYWRDNEHFIFHDFNKEIFYVFYINDNNFSIEYRPLYNSQAQLEDYVKAQGFEVSTNERLRLLGLKQSSRT